MARTSLLTFENKEYQKWIDNFKIKTNIIHDKDLAEELDLTPSGYSHFKRTNKFPYEKFILASLKNRHQILLFRCSQVVQSCGGKLA